jgi:hypothetical protein
MINKLQLRAARPRTAGTIHRRLASISAISRPKLAASALSHGNGAFVHRQAALRAQWFRNATTGALECHWANDAVVEPPMRRGAAHLHPVLRMPRRTRRAGMRPPSR